MIDGIAAIQGTGLFLDASCPHPFQALTVIYAENGRGKSTLAAALRSAKSGDPSAIVARRTIDDPRPQFIKIPVSAAQGSGELVLGNSSWTAPLTFTEIFDSQFIVENVYSGDQIAATQRASLLNFCLGEAAVTLQKQFNDLTNDQAAAQTEIRVAEGKLNLLARSAMNVANYVAAVQLTDIDNQLTIARERLRGKQQLDQLQAQPRPVHIEAFAPLDSLLGVLQSETSPIDPAATTLVANHIAHLDSPDASEWVREGIRLQLEDDCPFCSQSTIGVPLVNTYREFFNDDLIEIATNVTSAESTLKSTYGDSAREVLGLKADLNASRIAAWSSYVEVGDLDVSVTSLDESMSRLEQSLLSVIAAKRSAPALNVLAGTGPGAIVSELNICDSLRVAYNSVVDAANARIDEYSGRIAGATTGELEATILRLEVQKSRFDPAAVAAVAEFQAATNKKASITTARSLVRTALDAAIASTMPQYADAVNRILRSFSSTISIESMNQTYTGGTPRMDYALAVRSQGIGAGSQTFANSFSDGDRRALALAFFLARLEIDPDIAVKTVFIDDPMSSLDAARRSNTINLLVTLSKASGQLIVASHDAYFLQGFVDRWRKWAGHPLETSIEIRGVGNGYSGFGLCDLDALCRSAFVQRVAALEQYVAGGAATGMLLGLAQSLRPTIEGYLHRRFPTAIPRRTMLNTAINSIEHAPPASPLTHLTNSVLDLHALADYANQFHHDTNADADSALVTDAELRGHVDSVLTLLHSGKLP